MGQLPSENGLLTSLTKLKMEKNSVGGILPTTICQLTNLVELSFTNNHLSETIPKCIGTQLQNLQSVSLSRNRFTGSLPDEWIHLKQLENMLLSRNMLTGNPLPILNQLPKLKNVLISANKFTGLINETFLSSIFMDPNHQLQKLDLSDNQFTTSRDLGLPSHLFNQNITSLAVVDLSKNTLYGTIPSDISLNSKLSYLSLYGNQISGTIPTQVKNLHGLQHFDLSDNNFEGNLPAEIGEMTNLRFLSLSKNDLLTAGSVPMSFSSLKKLEYFSLRDTNRIGNIPSYIDQYAKNLIYLDLSHNEFTGALPLQLYSLSNLQIVMLNNNPTITGVIPLTIGYWKNLHGAFFDGTSLQGSLEPLCPLIAMAKHEIIYANCHPGSYSTAPLIACSCCHCCSSESNSGCSERRTTDLDKALEYVFQMIDYSASIVTVMDPDFTRDGVCY
jgi:Leucine-rich repeat (LRR) protein